MDDFIRNHYFQNVFILKGVDRDDKETEFVIGCYESKELAEERIRNALDNDALIESCDSGLSTDPNDAWIEIYPLLDTVYRMVEVPAGDIVDIPVQETSDGYECYFVFVVDPENIDPLTTGSVTKRKVHFSISHGKENERGEIEYHYLCSMGAEDWDSDCITKPYEHSESMKEIMDEAISEEFPLIANSFRLKFPE